MSKREEKRTRQLGACVLLLIPAGKSAESINFDDDIYQFEVRGIHGKKKSVKHGEKTNTRTERVLCFASVLSFSGLKTMCVDHEIQVLLAGHAECTYANLISQ